VCGWRPEHTCADRIVTAESVSEESLIRTYLAGAALLGFAPEECVVFEDAASARKLEGGWLYGGGYSVFSLD